MNTDLRTRGFTLLELLLAAAIGLLILGLVLAMVMSSNRLSSSLTSSALSQQELLNAAELLGSRVREAALIVPSGASVTLPDTAKTRNLSGSATTVIGTAATPMLAMLLPPQTLGAACTPGAAPAVTEGCPRFVAYYPVLRSTWLAATSSGANFETDYPGASAANDSAWVLAEFGAPIAFTPGTSYSSFTFTSGTARLLLDMLVPATAAPTYNLFTLQTSQVALPGVPSGSPGYDGGGTFAPYVSSVTFRFAAQRQPGPRLPATGTYQLDSAASNIGRIRPPDAPWSGP